MLQLNASILDFHTKIDDILDTTDRNKTDIVAISESNRVFDDLVKVAERDTKFLRFSLEDKLIDVEDNEKPTIVIKVRQPKGNPL